MAYTPDPRIAPYLAALEAEGPRPYVSHTHEVLWRLGREHGHDTVKALLDAHWSHLRAAREASK